MIKDTAGFRAKKSNLEETIAARGLNFNFNFNLSRKLILLFGVVLMVGLSALAVMYYTNYKTEKTQNDRLQEELVQEETEEIPITYEDSLDFGLEQPNLAFDKKELTSYVPFDADFYLVGSNLSSLYQLFWGDIDQSGLASFLADYIKEPFVIFGQRVNPNSNNSDQPTWQLALILFLSDDSLNQATIDAQNFGDFQVRKIDQAVVVTKYTPFFDQVADTSKDLAKNVSQKPKFLSDREVLAPSGQLLFMNFTDSSEDLYNLATSFLPSQDAAAFLKEALLDNQHDKFVVRKQ